MVTITHKKKQSKQPKLTYASLHPLAFRIAMILASHNKRRIEVLSKTEALVHNHPQA